ncbi:protein ZW2 [Pyrus x bretschneideri]|uniref:protein ZW2 n=1 Tax=Pyrus x bretschneideri TaxID=225117 RepID=UPI0020303605|nr:protein ZW2 [Pyrus x bretschneideri]
MAAAHPGRERFVTFLGGWLDRQQTFLDQLLNLVESPDYENKDARERILIEQVLSHYQQYFAEKARTAEEDAFVLFSPPWLSSFERSLLWLGGFKPSMVLRMVDSSVEDLTAEQVREMDAVKGETRRAERDLSETMARIQESVAAPPILALARRVGRPMEGEISSLDMAMEMLKTAMLGVFESADGLRGSTVRKVVEVLSPEQTVKVLAAVAQFQLRIRRWGLQRDTQLS